MNTQAFDVSMDKANLVSSDIEPTGLTLSLLRNVNDCVKLIGTDGRLKFMNENGMCLMELPELDSVRGYFWWDLWPAESHGLLQDAVKKAGKGELARFRADCPTGQGTMKSWDVTVTPVPEKDGEIVNLLAISREIK